MWTTTVWRCCSNFLNTCRLGCLEIYHTQTTNTMPVRSVTALTRQHTALVGPSGCCRPTPAYPIIPAQHTTQVGPSGCCRPTPAYPHHPSSPCRSQAPVPESPPCTLAPSSSGPWSKRWCPSRLQIGSGWLRSKHIVPPANRFRLIKIQTHERFKITLFIRTKHNMQIWGVTFV